jgi:hypothetical protein
VFYCAIAYRENIVDGDTEADLVEDFICVFCVEPLGEGCGRVFCRGEELDDVRQAREDKHGQNRSAVRAVKKQKFGSSSGEIAAIHFIPSPKNAIHRSNGTESSWKGNTVNMTLFL